MARTPEGSGHPMKQPFSIRDPATFEPLFRCRKCDSYHPRERFHEAHIRFRKTLCKGCQRRHALRSYRRPFQRGLFHLRKDLEKVVGIRGQALLRGVPDRTESMGKSEKKREGERKREEEGDGVEEGGEESIGARNQQGMESLKAAIAGAARCLDTTDLAAIARNKFRGRCAISGRRVTVPAGPVGAGSERPRASITARDDARFVWVWECEAWAGGMRVAMPNEVTPDITLPCASSRVSPGPISIPQLGGGLIGGVGLEDLVVLVHREVWAARRMRGVAVKKKKGSKVEAC